MEDLPEALFAEVIKRITRTSDLNSLSLVSKQLYKTEADQRSAIRVGCGLCPATEALVSLCTRFRNLHKVEIDYSGSVANHGNQLDNKGLFVFSSHCLLLTSLSLSFCSNIDDSGLGYLANFNKLASLRLDSTPNITSRGLLAVAVGCKSLSALHLNDCQSICSKDWLEYLGYDGSLEELIVKNCDGISQDDFMKFGPGWMKLQKFVFEINDRFFVNSYLAYEGYDPSYNAHSPNMYDIFCESLKDLSLACIEIATGKGLRFLLGRCKALEKLCLEYVRGLNDNDMIALSQSCNNLKSISLWLDPQFYARSYRTAFTDKSLKALALSCPMLETVELTFAGCAPEYPSEIGFTQEGLVVLIQSCPIRVLVLNGANFFDAEGMEAVSCAPYLETLELVDCEEVTDAGMRFIARTPCLINLTIRLCGDVTDVGVAELVQAQKLESLIIEGCPRVSLQAVKGIARSVQYSVKCASAGHLNRKFHKNSSVLDLL
ncbi:F-box/LRR-repeat protein 14-like [Lolium rigidum]|uniref:F-box/LRR-repeat protein 14-like n=1 Tax=Lolium rigidum TaxID=89674 RepID=UPI001F5C59ED|nr:F-box/LRR-repeat protein 14-like [Lolium rigidum]XP_047049765.1 F-box/LRR-repeat protein 14-like [Lolium rigidum]XP_047049767.1 F-box/LRR-repeat protein 14-like [Lolium rigidum]XP_047049768.1 F-box/LRR-repeat protein 14-like [Lolium rigidum]